MVVLSIKSFVFEVERSWIKAAILTLQLQCKENTIRS